MCADEAAMEWAKAWKSKGPAPQKLGFIYMLNGDNGTSNTDPFATEETRDNNWIKTGSHVMIVGAESKSIMSRRRLFISTGGMASHRLGQASPRFQSRRGMT